MESCSAGIVPIQKGDKFSQMQCPKNDLERKRNGVYSLCFSVW